MGKWEKSSRGGMTPAFSSTRVSWYPPHALKVMGDPDKEERRGGRSGNDLGAGLTGLDGGINERLREVGFFANLSPPLFGCSARPKSR
jgi:hypothetical protein